MSMVEEEFMELASHWNMTLENFNSFSGIITENLEFVITIEEMEQFPINGSYDKEGLSLWMPFGIIQSYKNKKLTYQDVLKIVERMSIDSYIPGHWDYHKIANLFKQLFNTIASYHNQEEHLIR